MNRCSIALAILSAVIAGTTAAQERPDAFPTRAIKIVVPFPAGGPSDVLARMIGQKMNEDWGQPVLVENHPGANTVLAAQQVAKAAPDGYTLLMISSGNLTTNPSLFAQLPYDTQRDFTSISNVAYTSYALDVHPSLPVKSVQELIALAKQKPGQIDAAIPGAGTGGHLALELFMDMSGTKFTQVAYKGAAPALSDTIGGQTKVIMDALSTSIAHVRAGKVRALGQSGTVRSPLLPDVPTIAEQGLLGYEFLVYNALLGPPGLPAEIVQRLHAEIVKAGAHPLVRDRFAELGITMTASTPAELSSFVSSETDKWARLIRAAGIKAQ